MQEVQFSQGLFKDLSCVFSFVLQIAWFSCQLPCSGNLNKCETELHCWMESIYTAHYFIWKDQKLVQQSGAKQGYKSGHFPSRFTKWGIVFSTGTRDSSALSHSLASKGSLYSLWGSR